MVVKVPKHNGKVVDDGQRQELIDAARRYIGTPWQHMGRNKYGLDCAGLLVITVYDVLKAWVEVSDYSPWPRPAVMREICNRILVRSDQKSMMPGDVILLYVPGIGVCHMGWYAGNTLIHASNEAGMKKVVEHSIHPDWNLRGVYSVPQFTGA
jgi:cell wall-associated NlpC family hydrolase